MSDEGLVDILLVRLGRDEEKERVKSLLIKELGFSEEEAEQAVAKTPNMIRKAVPMGKGRVIQNRLYPYIDLLPRMDLVDDDDEAAEEETEGAGPEQDEARPAAEEEPVEEPEGEGEVEQEVPGLQTAATAVMDAGFSEEGTGGETAPEAEPEPQPEEKRDEDEDLELEDEYAPPPPPEETEEEPAKESEGMVVTSAAEEMRQIERCHICGRTPTDGERLAPCRSCGELTCRDCFDRMAHVCKKCAAAGKFVDKPPQRRQKTRPQPGASAGKPAPAAASGGGGGYNRNLLVGIAAALVVLVLLAVGYFVDPLGIFSDGSASTPAAGGAGPADSLPAVADTASVDTSSAVAADTAATDSLASAEPAGEPGPLNLAAARLDSSASLADPAEVPLITSPGVRGLDILDEDLEAIAGDIGRVASSASIDVDAATLFRTESGISVLALSILHPEEDTRRYALLRGLGHYLVPTGVDELVFYYRENQYYDARVVPYLNSSFPDLSQATGPMEFQELTGCSSAEQWELLDGEVRDWLTSVQR
ncbi:MAG: FYVE zinc finger domain-containing protein [Candidatus Fermentibacteraceae bacterium]